MRVLIVDDEPAARQRLALMLGELDVEVAGEADGGLAALAMVRERRPDVVLLDIAMPEVDGLDVARHLPEPRPAVIFQTAFDRYALRAFEVEAVDYLLKPVTLVRLREALARAERRLAGGPAAALSADALDRLQAALAGATGAPAARRARLLVRDGEGHRVVALREVIRCHAEERVVQLYTAAGGFSTDLTLGELETRGAGRFARANRADLVNLDAVVRLTPDRDGSAELALVDGTTVRVSRRRVAEVRAALEG